MINIPWGNDFALKVPIKKKVIQTTGEIEIQDFDVSSVEQLHVFLQHNEHLPDWHSSQVEWSADPENSSGIIVEVSSQMAPIGMYNIILTGVQNGRRFFSQQCRQFKIIGNASSSDLVIYEGIQTYTLDEVIVLDARGRDGLSAYELAVARGFEGTESEWMATLKGENGNGVAGVELIEQVGNVDHYRMTFTDGTYFDYTVTNSSGTLTPEQIAEIVTELSNTITAGDLNAYTKTEVNNLLNSKANTSDIPTSLSDLNDDATHRTVTDTEKQTWNNKQEPISDLNTIRQNSSNAYQKPNTGIPLSDLSEEVQDAIENAGSLTEETDPIFVASAAHGITSNDITNWNGKYTKSNSGIPKTDLANDVQTSLGKADTALQSYTESDPTVPSHVKAITTTDISNWNNKQPALTFDSTPTAGSNNPVTSAGIKAYVDNATPTITMDDTPTSGSSNPVKSSGIYNALQGKQNTLTFDTTPTASSSNPVTSGGVKTALDLKANQSTTYTKTEVDGLLEDVAYLSDDDGQATTLDFDPQADTVWNKAQTLGSAQQAQARNNIGAVGSVTVNGTTYTPTNGDVDLGTIGGSSGDVNVIETVKVNGTALEPDANKAVDITVPSAVTESTVSGWGFTKNNGNVSSTDVTTIVYTTQAAYDALATKDSNTLYIIPES